MIRVLVVDDALPGRCMLRDALAAGSDTVEITECGSLEAQALLCRTPFDVILTDSSYLALLRAAAGVPVIVVMEEFTEAAALESLRAGAADCLPKTAGELARLPAAIRQALARRSAIGDRDAALTAPGAALAAIVAHDFNNLLTVTAGYATQLLNRLEPGDPSRQLAAEIIAASERGELLTGQLLLCGPPVPAYPRPFDLNQTIRELEPALRSLGGGDAGLRLTLCRETVLVLADPGQLGKALVNLVLNCRPAISKGATLQLETSPAEPGDGGSAYSRISVHLTGGCAPGSWFLAAAAMVRNNGGFVSNGGDGTAFRMYLPRAAREPAPRQASRRPAAGSSTVLLVEDDPHLRSIVAQGLRAAGYRILEAPRPQVARQLARDHAGTIDLLLTDVILPGQRGDDLAQQILEYQPGAKVLYMSGHANHLSEPVRASFLAKPFTLDTLVRRIDELSGARGLRPSVLLVDDDAAVLSCLSGLMSAQGLGVRTAGTVEDALREWRSAVFDLAVVDLKLPDRSGAEAILEMLRLRPAMPVIAISGAYGSNFLKMMESIGVTAAIAKPIQSGTFLSTVRQALRLPLNAY